MNDNLVSMKKLQYDIQSMKLLSFFLSPEKRRELKDLEKQLLHISEQFGLFIKHFSNNGWCIYDSMNLSLIESANDAFQSEGIETAEKILLNYYKNDIQDIFHKLKDKSNEFMLRYELINNAFNDHIEGRYYASIPLFLILMDGAVNDFTKSKGFFVEGTDVSAWDCFVGCDNSLAEIKKLFSKGRNKTNTEEIFLPYRNGILHGRDLNYANEYVSCKCVAMLFAIADWMSLKNSEEARKEKLRKEMNPPSISESIQKHKQNQIDKKEICSWKARKIIVGKTIKSSGNPEDYVDYPYIQPLFDIFDAWDKNNYGKLSILLKRLFIYEPSETKRAGECRNLFKNKKFLSFELKEVEERGCSMSRILVQANWTIGEKHFLEPLEFGCVYQNKTGKVAFPWRNDGEWIVIPWNTTSLYKS